MGERKDINEVLKTYLDTCMTAIENNDKHLKSNPKMRQWFEVGFKCGAKTHAEFISMLFSKKGEDKSGDIQSEESESGKDSE